MIRRYIIIGAFDGITYAVSTITAIAITGIDFERSVLAIYTGLFAIAISSAWNSLVVEAKEKGLELKRLEQQVLRSLKGTIYDYAIKFSIIFSVISHGVSPLIGAIPILIYTYTKHLSLTIMISLISLGILGLFYEGNTIEKLKSVGVMMAAGVFAILVAIFLNH
ncbi:MAG: hypothetical protein QXL33_05100 [Sulfolobaceae archaeon]